MGAEEHDWRLTSQERYLQGAALVWALYRAPSDTWDHDHCEFCWAKFMDPQLSAEARRIIEGDPAILTEGYTTTAEHERGAGYHWICKQCFEDFAGRFEWRTGQADR